MGSRTRRLPHWRLLPVAMVFVVAFALPAAAATGWTIVASPNPAGAPQTYLDAVSCTGTTTVGCFAVGSYITTGGAIRTLIERWSGTSWKIVTSPNRAGASSSLVSVKCATPTSCFAVGNSQATPTAAALTLIERWNGTAWTITPSPNAPHSTGNYLQSIACTGTTRCFAVGDYTSGGTSGSTLIERWNGSTWTVAPSPNAPHAAISTLAGVSCTTAIALSCFAVGSYSATSTASAFFTLTERWNGSTWAVVPSPNVGGMYKSSLNAVSCTSSKSCVAVGMWQHSPGASLSERWNGAAWTIVAVSNHPGWTFSQLDAVSCTSTTSCVAVGNWSNGTPAGMTLIVRFNGTTWTPLVSPSPAGAQGSSLAGISCLSTRCFAVGSSLKPSLGNPSVTLTERNF